MKKLVVSVLAHVDAGKTTTIEGLLFVSGILKKPGRVDHGDACLDYDDRERKRGITIYDKTARLTWKDTEMTLIDTPGHVDFSSEMERAMPIADLALVVISATDGIQGHTADIIRCLDHYQIPILFFINKMDLGHRGRGELLAEMEKQCGRPCIDLMADDHPDQLAMVNEEMMDCFLADGSIEPEMIRNAAGKRMFFPVIFGSALRADGLADLLDAMTACGCQADYSREFGGRVYRISYDEQGTRLTHIRLTGGTLAVRDLIGLEKVDQIRCYNGRSYDLRQKVEAGTVCALKGLNSLLPGDGFGAEREKIQQVLNAYVEYELYTADAAGMPRLYEICRQLDSEDPMLNMHIDPVTRHIRLRMMGPVQREVLTGRIRDLLGREVLCSLGTPVYAETVSRTVEGIGHYEPLRHYAEVWLKLEPGERGSGLKVDSICPVDRLALPYQKSILAALQDTGSSGVLTGSALTDMRIILTGGRADPKHTEGGDFREAAGRALRQGLMKAACVLLEPYERFVIHAGDAYLSRILHDFEIRQCTVSVEQGPGGSMIRGSGPVRTMADYGQDLLSCTKGTGTLTVLTVGYEPTCDQDSIIKASGYDPDRDTGHPSGSVFCIHGLPETVPWDQMDERMHLRAPNSATIPVPPLIQVQEEDLEQILAMAGGRNRNPQKQAEKKAAIKDEPVRMKASDQLPNCLIVDGYNMIYDWPSLRQIADEDIGTAREKLIDELYSYQAWTGNRLIVVFDGYRRQDQINSAYRRGEDMIVIYTRHSLTADEYIQELAKKMSGSWHLTVATSDSLIQMSVFSQGALRMSARELADQIDIHKHLFMNLKV